MHVLNKNKKYKSATQLKMNRITKSQFKKSLKNTTKPQKSFTLQNNSIFATYNDRIF